jgi:undecaprenyl-diphosphatase
MHFLNAIDTWLFLQLNAGVANGFLDAVMPYYTNIHYWRWPIIVSLAALFTFGGGKGRSVVLLAILTLTITDQLSSTIIKPWIGRVRPCHVVEGARFITGCGHSFSMPSGHATNTMAAAILFGLLYRRILILLLTLSITVSYSRIYLGIHYPGDTLVGWIIGAAIAYGMVQLYERVLRQYLERWLSFHRRRSRSGAPAGETGNNPT